MAKQGMTSSHLRIGRFDAKTETQQFTMRNCSTKFNDSMKPKNKPRVCLTSLQWIGLHLWKSLEVPMKLPIASKLLWTSSWKPSKFDLRRSIFCKFVTGARLAWFPLLRRSAKPQFLELCAMMQLAQVAHWDVFSSHAIHTTKGSFRSKKRCSTRCWWMPDATSMVDLSCPLLSDKMTATRGLQL